MCLVLCLYTLYIYIDTVYILGLLVAFCDLSLKISRVRSKHQKHGSQRSDAAARGRTLREPRDGSLADWKGCQQESQG